MKTPNPFPDAAIFKDMGSRNGSRLFMLTEDFRARTSLGTITIPAGFTTDGASIPRVFWNVLSPFGDYFPAALLHDFLYSKMSDGLFDSERFEADDLFKEAMYNIGIGWITRETIYRAVRLFGGRNYKRR